MILTKSGFILYKDCPKQLQLHNNKPELEELDPSAEKHAQEGKEVGLLAKQYFENVIDVTSFKEDGSLDIENMIGLTNRYLTEANTTIAEATFSIDGLFCSVDILKPHNDDYDIIEVKATDESKKEHLLSIQI